MISTKLWKESMQAKHTNKQVCVALITQPPLEVRPAANSWLNAKGEEAVWEKQARELIRLVQVTLQQKGLQLDYGGRQIEKISLKRVEQELNEPSVGHEACTCRERRKQRWNSRRGDKVLSTGERGDNEH